MGENCVDKRLLVDRNVAAQKKLRTGWSVSKVLHGPAQAKPRQERGLPTWTSEWPINTSRWSVRPGPGPRGRAVLFVLFLNSPLGSEPSDYELPCCLLSHHEKWATQGFLPNLMVNYPPFFVLWPLRMSPYLIYFQYFQYIYLIYFSSLVRFCLFLRGHFSMPQTLWLVIITSLVHQDEGCLSSSPVTRKRK